MADGSLVWGSIDFSDPASGFAAYGDSVDFGAPEPVVTALPRLLLDGEQVTWTRDGNREITFQVEVSGRNGVELAEREALLVAEANKPRNTLTWTPPGFSVPTVFTTFRARLVHQFDDVTEILQRKRVYQVTLAALPSGRSQDLTLVGSVTLPNTSTVVDDCESVTGWSSLASPADTFSVVSTPKVTGTGAIQVVPGDFRVLDGSVARWGAFASVKKTLSVSMPSGGYLIVYVKADRATPTLDNVKITTSTGVVSASAVSVETTTGGFTKFAFAVAATTVTAFQADLTQIWAVNPGNVPPRPNFYIDSISTATTASTSGQVARTLQVDGSSRTDGSLQISSTVGLGDVLVYTAPDEGDGFRPDVRRWQVQGTNTNDAAAVNGSYAAVNQGSGYSDTADPNFEIPASTLRPGDYLVLARIKGTTTNAPLNLDARVRVAGVDVGPVQELKNSFVLAAANTYQIVTLGILGLPTVAVDAASGAVVRLRTGGSTSTFIDDIWLFPRAGALTWVSCGTGAPSPTVSSRLWVNSPSLNEPRGAIWRGTAADQSDARSAMPDCLAKASHVFTPPQMFTFVVTTGAQGPSVSLTYFKRWHTNAAS